MLDFHLSIHGLIFLSAQSPLSVDLIFLNFICLQNDPPSKVLMVSITQSG